MIGMECVQMEQLQNVLYALHAWSIMLSFTFYMYFCPQSTYIIFKVISY